MKYFRHLSHSTEVVNCLSNQNDCHNYHLLFLLELFGFGACTLPGVFSDLSKEVKSGLFYLRGPDYVNLDLCLLSACSPRKPSKRRNSVQVFIHSGYVKWTPPVTFVDTCDTSQGRCGSFSFLIDLDVKLYLNCERVRSTIYLPIKCQLLK